MLLELKKVTFSEKLSDDSNAFTAEVFINGVKRATAQNHGTGGPTAIHAYAVPRKSPEGDKAYFEERNANQVFIDQYETWAKQQPEIETNLKVEGGANFTYARSIEADVDLLLEEWLKAQYAKKDEARLKRLCKKEWIFTLHEKDGKPTDPNELLTIKRAPTHQLAAVGKHLRDKYGDNLKQFFNEIYG